MFDKTREMVTLKTSDTDIRFPNHNTFWSAETRKIIFINSAISATFVIIAVICLIFLNKSSNNTNDETILNNVKDLKGQLDETKKELESVKNVLKGINLKDGTITINELRNEYFDECAFNKIWRSCKIFKDEDKHQIIALPRNEDEKAGTWSNSMEICIKYNASLFAIESESKQKFIQEYLGHKKIPFWTSGKLSDGKFRWFNQLKSTLIGFTNWRANQPDNHFELESCIEIFEIGLDHSKWNDLDCDTKRLIACEFSFNF